MASGGGYRKKEDAPFHSSTFCMTSSAQDNEENRESSRCTSRFVEYRPTADTSESDFHRRQITGYGKKPFDRHRRLSETLPPDEYSKQKPAGYGRYKHSDYSQDHKSKFPQYGQLDQSHITEDSDHYQQPSGWMRRRGKAHKDDYPSTSLPARSMVAQKGKTINRDKSWFESVQCFPFDYIRTLSQLPSEELVKNIFSKMKGFQSTLQRTKTFERSGMDIILVILSKVADSMNHCDSLRNKACQILGEALSERCAVFQFYLKMYVSKELHQHSGGVLNLTTRCEDICKLFHDLLLFLPGSSWSCLPVDELKQAVEQLPSKSLVVDKRASLFESIETILSLRDNAREQHSRQLKTKKAIESQWDNSEYKNIEILPQWREVCVSQKPRLRKNIISGSYTDWLHYYDIQFRLLREDFIAPLRNGICEYLEGVRGRKLKNVRVYRNVLIKEPKFSDSGMCYQIQLDFSHLRHRLNWEHSKKLLHGSLLCLSPEDDNFNEEVYFATVIDRDPKKIAEGELLIMFKRAESMLSFCCTSISFIMVESCAYFEASQHILHSLQTAEVETMPFTKYLINGNCSSVDPPQYLTEISKASYDLTFLLTDEEKCTLAGIGLGFSEPDLVPKDVSNSLCGDISAPVSFLVNHVENFNNWPVNDRTELDESQLKGLHMALTQEMAVIQGPPGTGKTYIGLKIVEALQMNSKIWNSDKAKSPILVMCYTNHALDQFLEGILNNPLYKDEATEEIKLVRIGRRSQSEQLADFNLTCKRRNIYLPWDVLDEKSQAEENVQEFRRDKTKTYFTAKNACITLSIDELNKNEIIHPKHYSDLYLYVQTPQQESCVLEIWLGLVAVVNHKGVAKITTDEILALLSQACSNNSALSPAKKQVENVEEKQESGQEDESDSESFIDVVGEAMREELERVFDDVNHYRVRDNTFHDHNNAYTNYYRRLDTACSDWHYTEFVQNTNLRFSEEQAKKILHIGFSLPPMPEKESLNVRNIHALSYYDRWRLYHYWHSQYLKHLCEECEQDFLKYNELCTEREEARKKADRFALESAEIIGMTTTGAAKYQHILHLVKPRIVIVEEAAEVLESHIVSALNAGTQHLILIGDHKQLRPKPNEYELAKKYNLDISLFERLIRNGFPHATLEYQHRMRPEIAELVKPHIYSVLSNHPSVEKYENVRGVSTNLFFIKHETKEKEDENLMSHSNVHEASYLVSLCRYLLQQCYIPQQITILVTYSGQLLTIRKLMPRSEFEGVRVSTVDNFQGEENDIILLSLVRSNSEKNVGFLREENRVCVALSRARQGFYCIGNFDMLREQVPLWEAIMADMEQKGKLGDGLLLHCSNHPENNFVAKSGNDFEGNSPKGGCLLDCTFRLKCGHVCTQKCHCTDPEHTTYDCMKPCTKTCPEGHPCPKLCYLECKCEVRVTRTMPNCNHEQEMYCHEDPAKVKCISPCKKKCPKGHVCPLKCHEGCDYCMVKVSIIMPSCHHEQLLLCYQNPNHVDCTAECSYECKNGHKCPKLCHEYCGNCTVPLTKTITECNHEITLPCYVDPKHSECTMPCEKILPCSHKCSLKCGEFCSSRSCMHKIMKELPDCGHLVEVSCYKSKVSIISCDKVCDRLLPCGHPCGLKCSKPCKTQCARLVNKAWPCGHKLKRPCYQIESPEDYPCKKDCEKFLKCDHLCPNKCGQPCDAKCKVKICKPYPCGHMVNAYCSSTLSEFPCKLSCSHILACGHKCDGKCSTCTTRHMHEPCRFKIGVKRFCGHSFQTSCSGISDTHPGKKDISIVCSHKEIERNCSEELRYSCGESCEWKCIHFICSKPCSEKCDRPSCGQRCSLKLKCDHQCYGLCGEPCLSVCPECRLRSFRTQLKSADHFSKDGLYYELTCKHIFPVQYLDEYVHGLSNPQSHILVCPIQCPVKECSQPLSCSYRYGNAVKKCLSYVQDVNAILLSPERELHYMDDKLYSRMYKVIKSNDYIEVSHNHANFVQVSRNKSNWISINRGRLFIKFEPLLEISKTLYKLKIFKFRRSEERYLFFVFLEGINNLKILLQSSSLLSGISDYEMVLIETKEFLRYLAFLINQHEFKLTYQIIVDLQSELFRLYLCVHILLAKSTSLDIDLVLNEAESCVKTERLISESKFQHHIKGLSRILHFSSRLYEQFISEIHSFYPLFEKGQWWRCTRGHYYCSPTTVLEDVKLKCPRCEGKNV